MSASGKEDAMGDAEDRDDDLYSEDFPALNCQGFRVRDSLAAAESATDVNSTEADKPTNNTLRRPLSELAASSPTVRISAEYARINENQRVRDYQQQVKHYQLLQGVIQWREGMFWKSINNYRRGQLVRFIWPLSQSWFSQLAMYPDLLFAYFVTERKFNRIIRVFKDNTIELITVDEYRRYALLDHADQIRREDMISHRQEYAKLTVTLLQYIHSIVRDLTRGENKFLQDNDQVTLLDDLLLDFVIRQDPTLNNWLSELTTYERQYAPRRFGRRPKYTGDYQFDASDHRSRYNEMPDMLVFGQYDSQNEGYDHKFGPIYDW